jgi:hypothetical protein
MLIPDEVLQAAMKGGWTEHGEFEFAMAVMVNDVVLLVGVMEPPTLLEVGVAARPVAPEAVVFDLNFWMGLSETLGWEMVDDKQWMETAYRLCELLLTNMPLEAFWENLLKGARVGRAVERRH